MITSLLTRDTMYPMEFVITKRDRTKLIVLLDEQDSDLAGLRWHMAGGKGPFGKYVARVVDGKTSYLHRVVAERMGIPLGAAVGNGSWRVSVDHINGDKLDNRRENLRSATRVEQMMNRADGLRSTNTSGHRGVYLNRQTGKWVAFVTTKGRAMYLGQFTAQQDAVARRLQWERQPWSPPPRRRKAICGTPAMYQQHRAHGEKACEACLAARAAEMRARAARPKTGGGERPASVLPSPPVDVVKE